MAMTKPHVVGDELVDEMPSEGETPQDRPEELRLIEALLFAAGEPLDEAALARRLPNGVDVTRFHPPDHDDRRSLRASLGIPVDRPVVPCGRIVHWPPLRQQTHKAASDLAVSASNRDQHSLPPSLANMCWNYPSMSFVRQNGFL
jgi:hypothetical protein